MIAHLKQGAREKINQNVWIRAFPVRSVKRPGGNGGFYKANHVDYHSDEYICSSMEGLSDGQVVRARSSILFCDLTLRQHYRVVFGRFEMGNSCPIYSMDRIVLQTSI